MSDPKFIEFMHNTYQVILYQGPDEFSQTLAKKDKMFAEVFATWN
jgi:hypothetical protein